MLLSGVFMSLITQAFLFSYAGACPRECTCRDRLVTCSNRRLTLVPRNIPADTERLDLQNNHISSIGRTDFAGLSNLRKLQINSNRLSFVHEDAFRNLQDLRTLNLENNWISCLEVGTFRNLRHLEVLTLNNNNLTGLIDGIFEHQTVLRTLRLHTNPLRCDCHLRWLVEWLQTHRSMAVFSHCHNPFKWRNINLAMAPSDEFSCNELTLHRRPTCERLACPSRCTCDDGIADCRDRGLTSFPLSFPSDVTEIRLEQNNIEVIPSNAFSSYSNLQRIDISNNAIREIEKDAFQGLTQLTSLVMYSNKITSLPKGIFEDLTNLQLLLLNANKLKCLREDAFVNLNSLTLLSLYDNKLQTLSRRTFDSLSSIQTLHLAQNPFICDCNLKWLAKYLRKNPVETSDAKCAGPQRTAGKMIVSLKSKRFRCQSGSNNGQLSSECIPEAECPSNCQCEGTRVDCSGQSLTALPDNIPPYAAELDLSNNNIEVITNSMAFKKLNNLKKIDLTNNQLTTIEDGAFMGASSVVTLWLNNNQLSNVRGSMFRGLNNLKTLSLRNNRLACIGNHTFAGLSTVTHLSLYSNQVATVLSGAFETMTSLSTLNLLSNPLNCNCHLAWLSTWIRKSSVASGNPRCEEPRFMLQGLPVADINPRDFRCSSEEMARPAPTCLPEKKCPESCTCEGTVIRCNDRGLTSVPINDLPNDVTELYLEMNSISQIPTEIKKFVYLTTLDLSYNHITSISGWMFSNLTRLSTLILSYNRLRCIPPNAFAGLRSLKILNLHSNDLSTLPEGVFDDLVSLSNVGLGANPWYCDCNLRWFARWVKAGNLEAGIARCSGPNRTKGRLIMSSSLQSFQCQGPLDIAVAVKCNPCLSSPCQHDSTCHNHAIDYYQCICRPGFKGRHCEMTIDPCILSPCRNGGRCQARDELAYTCTCEAGFEGDNCEINIDDCSSSPCSPENSTCVDGINQYTCQCPFGWEGENCDERMSDICTSQQPCLNGATCVPVMEIDTISYRCECAQGYRGTNCSEKFDACMNHKCENGGVCEQNAQAAIGYQCNCIGEYSGQYCSSFPGHSVNILQDDPCSQHDCLNGAECYRPTGQSDYQCRCLIGYSGARCEKLLSASFHRNGSYVELESSFGGARKRNITLVVSTTQENGVVLYNGDSKRTREHLAVEFYSGHIRLSHDLGKSPGSTVYSQIPIHDGNFHKVEILIQNQAVSLRIDNRDALVEKTEAGQLGVLDVTSPLFVGGIRSDVLTEAKRMWHIRNATSFTGCIDGLFINNAQADFVDLLPGNNDATRDVRPGCVRAGHSGSCSAARCDHGQCVFVSGRGVVCRCEEGYSGERCNIRDDTGLSCRNHKCQHGDCVANGNTYSCKCNKGFAGRYCAVADHCSGVDCGRGSCVATSSGYRCKCKKHYAGQHCQTRVAYCSARKHRYILRKTRPSRSTGTSPSGKTNCRSRRPIINLVCSNTCSNPRAPTRRVIFGQSDAATSLCCHPIRTVTKNVRMTCDDGSTYKQTMRKIRRCACQPCT